MNIEFVSEILPATDEDINNAEKKFGFEFPSSIINLLKISNGGVLDADILMQEDFVNMSESFVVLMVLGTSDYEKNLKNWPDGLLPICKDHYGNYLLFDKEGKIYYWTLKGFIDKALQAKGSDRLVLISDSLDHVVSKLKVDFD